MRDYFGVVCFLLIGAIGAGPVWAQVDSLHRIRLAAYLEAYYSYDTNEPSGERALAYNYSVHQAVALNVGLLQVDFRTERIRGALGLGLGSYFTANYADEPLGAQFIYEGYAGVAVSRGGAWWVDVGVLPSFYGFEGALGLQQLNLSRSLSAENSPYYQTGVRLMRNWGRWGLAVALLNGWQNIAETNRSKSLGSQIQFRPGAKWLLNWSSYFGDLPRQPDDRRKQWFNDLYLHYRPSERFEAVALFDWGLQQQHPTGMLTDATWHTANLTARYWFGLHWGLGGRVEYYSDPQAAILVLESGPGNGAVVRSASLNGDYRPHPQALLRAEVRRFWSSEPIFPAASLARSAWWITLSIALQWGVYK